MAARTPTASAVVSIKVLYLYRKEAPYSDGVKE